jgi:hypothetical protein
MKASVIFATTAAFFGAGESSWALTGPASRPDVPPARFLAPVFHSSHQQQIHSEN